MNLRARRQIILYFLLAALFAVASCACPQAQNKGTAGAEPEGSQITVEGKIENMKTMGGYFVHSLEPGGEFFIMNQDPQVLEGLLKSGKTVTIEGRIVKGAEYLFIEKIDGQPYRATEVPPSQ
jgi:hypothetical protein